MGDLEITFIGPVAAVATHCAFQAGRSRAEFAAYRFSLRTSFESLQPDRFANANHPGGCAAFRRPRRRARRQHDKILNPARREPVITS